jgi:arsenate reductase
MSVTTLRPPRVLFLCVANAARSQMAEGIARSLWGEHAVVQSAGSRPSRVHPLAVAVLGEIRIDATQHHSKHVDAIDPASIDVVITLCAEEECPVFLGRAARLSWAMPDPDRREDVLAGSSAGAEEALDDAARLNQFRATRDALRTRLQEWQAAGYPV